MAGSVTVSPGGVTTVTPTTTATPTTETTPASLLVGVPSLRHNQRGAKVRGSLDISQAGAGARLEVDLLASASSLEKTKHPVRVRVGRLVRGSARSGEQSFVVSLDAKAIRALKHRRSLALTVKIVLAPLHGAAVTVTRTVVLHP
jgi:hypothetical protein